MHVFIYDMEIETDLYKGAKWNRRRGKERAAWGICSKYIMYLYESVLL